MLSLNDGQQASSQNNNRSAFGMGVLAGGLACAACAAIAFFTQSSPVPAGNLASFMIPGAPGKVNTRGAATAPITSDEQEGSTMPPGAWSMEVVQQMAVDKDGSAMRSTVDMMAKSKAKYNEFCFGLPGAIAPYGRGWDPLRFSARNDEKKMLQFREAELTHGRVSMLASLGFIVQEQYHPFFSGENGVHWEIIPKAPNFLWFGVALGAGICEAARIQAMNQPGYTPGDIGFDPLGIKPTDAKAFRERQEQELSHGRLAMIAAAGFIIQEAVSGTTWGPTWEALLKPLNEDVYASGPKI
jgi:hypothetical protein